MTALGTVIGKGLHSARPGAGTAGSLYYETDTTTLFRDNGSGWDSVASNAAAGLTNPMTTKGDVIVGDTSGVAIRKGVGSDGQVLTADAASTGGIKWAAAGGGGGLAQSFVGYNTIGGSWEILTASRAYWKSITLAATSTFQSIDVHLRPHVDAVTSLHVMIAADNSTAPGQMLAANSNAAGLVYLNNSSSVDTNGRWLSLPIGATLAAGTYWIGFMGQNTSIAVAFDGSGSDQYFTSSQYLAMGAYPTAFALTTSANKYSIRASILS